MNNFVWFCFKPTNTLYDLKNFEDEDKEEEKREIFAKYQKFISLTSPNLSNCFTKLTSSIQIDKLENRSVYFLRGIYIENENYLVVIDDLSKKLIRFDIGSNTIEYKYAYKRLEDYVYRPYMLRYNANEDEIHVSEKDSSVIYTFKLYESLCKRKVIKFNENLQRIWDLCVHGNSKRMFVLDTNQKNIFVYDRNGNFLRTLFNMSEDKEGFGHNEHWPRDIKISNNHIYVIDTCVCIYNFNTNKLVKIKDGHNCIHIFSCTNFQLIKVIKHRNFLRPMGLICDNKNNNIFTIANFKNNYDQIQPYQYLFCFNLKGQIVSVTCLNIDLRERGISDLILINKYQLVIVAFSAGLYLLNFQ